LGYTRDEMLAKSPFDIDLYPDPATARARILELQASGSVVYEAVHLARDGRHIPVEISAHLIELHGQRLAMAMARDLTERKRAENDRQVFQAQLMHVHKLESLGTLVGGVAHEINNPIMGIMNYAELIGEDERLTGSRGRMCGRSSARPSAWPRSYRRPSESA